LTKSNGSNAFGSGSEDEEDDASDDTTFIMEDEVLPMVN
jgi:hypothetical protein